MREIRTLALAMLVTSESVRQGRHSLSMDSLSHHDSLPQEKYCPSCKALKPLDEFGKDSYHLAGRTVYCKICRSARQKVLHNPAKHREYKLRVRFNLTQSEYNQIFFEQGGVCAICGKPEMAMDNTGKRVRALAIDHNHETGTIRQLLCGSCNFVVGVVEKDRERAKRVLKYLKRHDT